MKNYIRTVPDFPKKGIMFKDITTLLKDHVGFSRAVEEMTAPFVGKGINKVVCAESRGFIFGAVIAHRLKAGFVPLRKPGKLPAKTIKEEFDTEYSKDAFEMHVDAIEKGDRCLIVDDLLATGGTLAAAAALVERCCGKVEGISVLIELSFLNGRKKLPGYTVHSLIDYEKEE